MGRALAVVLAMLPAAGAVAQGKGPLPKPPWAKASPPKGWNELPGLAKSVSVTLEQSRAFGDVRSRAGAQAFAQPGTGAFYLSWLVADKAAPDKAGALRSALDAVRHSRIAASPDARSTEELKYSETVNENLAEAVLEWRHVSNETMSLVRAFAWVSPAGAPRLYKGECVVSTTDGKAPAAVEAACRQALAGLTAAVPAAERGALADLPAGESAPTLSVDEVASAAAAPPAAREPPSPDTIGAAPSGDQKILYTGPTPAPKSDSMSKWFVALGAALLLAGIYLTWRARFRARAAGAGASSAAAADGEASAAAEPESAAAPASEAEAASEAEPAPEPEPEAGPTSEPDPDSPSAEEKTS